MARVIKPLSCYEGRDKFKIFLSGSIEMGTAEEWQDRFVKEFKKRDCIIYNPRRDDWDSSWEQKIDNEQFRQQVEWELDRILESDLAAVYFAPGTKSPITLLELGFLGGVGKQTVVYCPEGFWRKGNVDIFCRRKSVRANATMVSSWEDFILECARRLDEW